jgi:hypothetical protein
MRRTIPPRLDRLVGVVSVIGLTLLFPRVALAAGEGKSGGYEIEVKPEASQLPGHTAAQHLTNGIYAMMILAALVGLAYSAGRWALGHHSGNPHHASQGRAGVLIALVVAFVLAAGPALVRWAIGIGSGVG